MRTTADHASSSPTHRSHGCCGQDHTAPAPKAFDSKAFASKASDLKAPVLPLSFEAESDRVEGLSAEQRTKLERDVFDHSRAVGLSLQQALGGPLSLSTLVSLLADAPVGCLQGEWQRQGRGFRLQRMGCGAGSCAQVCDYWREAVDGLVMGLGDDARYARQQSQGHGAEVCVDVFYAGGNPETDAAQRFAPVPETVLAQLSPLQALLKKQGVTLTFIGCAEKVLFYRLVSAAGPACGAGGLLLRNLVESELRTRCPGYTSFESSPVGVMREEH